MIEVEILGAPTGVRGAPSAGEIEQLCAAAAASRGVHDAHVAIEFAGADAIAALNGEHRGKAKPTDVLSFPIDGLDELGAGVARELGDIVICPEHTEDLREAIVHGMLHLLAMDHEHDGGEMLALQRTLLDAAPA
jgi:probable rRNA maturation factor